MALRFYKDGKLIEEAIDNENYVPTYEVEKLKDPSMYNLAPEDRERQEGLTPNEH